MLHNIRNRIVVKMILIVSACMALLCGVLVTLSTMEQRKQYLEELKMTGNVVRASIASEQERITKAKDQIKSRPTDYSASPEAKALQHSIESFLDSGEMTNVYVFYPEIVEKEGKTFLVTLQANQTMYDGGLKPLTEYELTPQFRKAYESALDTGTGMTQAYEDSLGTWVSIIYPIVDGQNRTIAILGVDFEYGTVQAELNRKVRLNVAVGVILGALFILIVSWTVRTMLRPVRELTRLSQQAAAGDLTVSIPVRQQDEVGQLASHYNTMIASIRELIRQIRELGLQVG
ncbi:MAG: methyl-accepting chemotaxis sensory transducer, partial [Paenibacillus sp.]|nr:methyl-accepting chemotaxis sensory transducer [Paenibacillus sp.]